MVRKFDFLVIGSGLAGMSFALKVAHKGTVALICKAGLEEANTYFAQGGIASVTILNLKCRLLRKSAFLFKSLRLGANKGLRLGADSASAALPFSKGGNQLPFEVGFF